MDKVSYDGMVKRDGKLFCEKCGADLSVKGSVQSGMHLDYSDKFGNGGSCAKCKNIIIKWTERTKQDKNYWR